MVCGLLAGTWGTAAPVLDELERVLSLLERGEIATAQAAVVSLNADHASQALVLPVQGLLELSAGQVAPAEATFRKALMTDPPDMLALWGLSLCLLTQNRVFEATTVIDRAAVLAPTEPRVKALQAYVYMLLGRTSDAILAGKTAMEGGEQSPFVMATLAQVHRRMGYAHKALEFGGFAARDYFGMDFLVRDQRVQLPLTMVITDTPSALAPPAASRPRQRTELELEVPRVTDPLVAAKALRISVPAAGATLRGPQRVQVAYAGESSIKFMIFLVDRVLRGMSTELPFHFTWDADACLSGEHLLTVRAYDYRGMLAHEDTITVTTLAGQPIARPETSARQAHLQRQLMRATLPQPNALSLFMHLGWWYKDVGETAQAVAAFEKAAAIDPGADGVLGILAQLYQANGLHPISPTYEISRGPASGLKRVALTFDDGPNPLYTPSILAELKRYGVRATFFVVGKMVQLYPDLTRQMVAEGHEMANHSYTHPNMTKLAQREIIAEVLRTRSAIKDITGRQTYLFRPPGGNIDEFVSRQLRALDYNIVYWNINAGEFARNAPAEQLAQMLAKVSDGSILLLHNGPVDGTLNILPGLLAELYRRGFTCVTVSELAKAD